MGFVSSLCHVMVEMPAVVVEITSVWKEKGTVTVTVIVHQVCIVAPTTVRGLTLILEMTAVLKLLKIVMVEMTAVVVEITSVWQEKGTVTVTVIVHQVCIVAPTTVRGLTLILEMPAVLKLL